MEIKVTFRHTEPMSSLRDYAIEKISKLEKYLDFPAEAHVVLSVEKFRHQVDVTLNLNGTWIKAVEETEDMYSAIDQVVETLEKQVKKYVEKLRDRRRESWESEVSSAEREEELSSEQFIIEPEEMEAKPMDPEEAAMQLSYSGRDFLVFRNSNTNQINVIYKKKNGNLGLIQPVG
ncbi:MAG: ribosome-associated translation inhibitor RaiA [Deltaproteobacteria bacterium]|nr:MAG: ribosome-associated translation inhibitor RaiA [Deltaproteobacteria bacterium]